MSRGARRKVARGVYADAIGLSAVVTVAGRRVEHRFKAGTPLDKLLAWRKTARARLELGEDVPGEATTFRQDAATYLASLPDDTVYTASMKTLLDHWIAAGHGDAPRSALTPAVIDAQLSAWAKAGAAASTVNHRRRVLLALWRALDGPQAASPAKLVPKRREPRRAARGLPWPVIRAILTALPDRGRPDGSGTRPTVNLTKVRLWVLATTGWPAAVLAAIEPTDLKLTGEHPHVVIRPRKKGRGVPAKTIPITPEAVTALKAFVRAKAFGEFSRSAMHSSFRRAVTTAKATWQGPWPAPEDVTVYDLRHSFLSRVYAATRDLRATAELGLHANLTTTARYAEAAVSQTAAAAVLALSKAVPRVPRKKGERRAAKSPRGPRTARR